MIHSSWDIVGATKDIASVAADTLEDAANHAFGTKGYEYKASDWFIDGDNNFRLFEYNGTAYIAKRARLHKANREVDHARHASERLEGEKISGKALTVIVPELFLLPEDNRCILVSPYVGKDLNSSVYAPQENPFTFDDWLATVRLMLIRGIVFRGFLPRNTISGPHDIYLIDWEDATFFDSSAFDAFDHLSRTNMVLNWSYLYGFHEVSSGLDGLTVSIGSIKEPDLVSSEVMFKNRTNTTATITQLRQKIDHVVFGAELPLRTPNKHFYLRPNDLGHLMADTFPTEVEVLYDFLSYHMRRTNESGFAMILNLASYIFTTYYRHLEAGNRTTYTSLQYLSLIPVMLLFDDVLSEVNTATVLSSSTPEDIIRQINKIAGAHTVTWHFLNDDPAAFRQLLENRIVDACKAISGPESYNPDNETLVRLFAYIEGHCRSKVLDIRKEAAS